MTQDTELDLDLIDLGVASLETETDPDGPVAEDEVLRKIF